MPHQIAIRNMKAAVKLYYSKPELETRDIKEIFECSLSTARKLKEQVKKVQIEKGRLTFSDSTVNTEVAFEVWGIDIEKAVSNLIKLQRFNEKTGNI